MPKQKWSAQFKDPSDTSAATHLGVLEFKDENGEWHNFDVLELGDKLIFGGACNVGLLESGYMIKEDDETRDTALQELLADLECYYNYGPGAVSRIIHNERM